VPRRLPVSLDELESTDEPIGPELTHWHVFFPHIWPGSPVLRLGHVADLRLWLLLFVHTNHLPTVSTHHKHFQSLEGMPILIVPYLQTCSATSPAFIESIQQNQ
jgi:hypothetical protein